MAATDFIEILDTVDSTNNYAMAKVRAGMAKHGMAVIAKVQTDGKGQRGKNWLGQPGLNIAISIIIEPSKLKPEQQFFISMLVSLAANDFIKKYIPKNTSIKWPNDLYWCDRKAGGILIENVITGNNWKWAVVGVGINVNQTRFTKALANPVSLKQITENKYDVIELATTLYYFVMKRIDNALIKNLKDTNIEYNNCLYKKNETVKLKKGNAVFNTTVKNVTTDGKLKCFDTMERQFTFGEVAWIL